MFHVQLLRRFAFALALVSLTSSACAVDTPTNGYPPKGSFACGYRIKAGRTFSELPYSYRELTTKDFADCVAECDLDAQCVAARFNPKADQGTENPICLLSDQLGFAVQPTKTDSNSDFAQLVPYSCKKPVAVPTATNCQPRIIEAPKSHCKYNVTCNVELDPSFSAAIAMVNNTEECAREAFKLTSSLGYTFFQGGSCFLPINFEYTQVNITGVRRRAETAQLIENSCHRAMTGSSSS